MTKRTNSSKEIPPAKRSRRRAGFRLARPVPDSSQPSGTQASTSTSLFVTVRQPDEQRGLLEAQNRVLTSTQESHAEPSIEPHTDFQDESIRIQNEPIQEDTVNPKRKRNTTNAVCCPPNFPA